MATRVAVYIDGFNLYHALDTFSFRSQNDRGARQEHLKWLCLQTLAKQLVFSRSETVVAVKYFSAFAEHLKATNPEKVQRHVVYQRALAAQGVECVLGSFKKKRVWCNVCRAYRPAREEKETDVNLATALLDDAYQDLFDAFFVVTTDTDFQPAIARVKLRFPEKSFVSVSTPGRPHAQALLALADRHLAISERMLVVSRLPEEVPLANGRVLRCPEEYRLPSTPNQGG